MTVQQISIFVENKAGTLLKVLELLKEANIQIVASTIADTVEYGIYRIICSEPERAYTTLQGAGISVAISDVFALTLDNVPGRAADAVMFLYRQDYYCGTKNDEQPSLVQLDIAKNRHGRTGETEFSFWLSTSTFKEVP